MHSPRLARHGRLASFSEMQCQVRSPGGRGSIIKKKRGTPSKISSVTTIIKLFEPSSTSTTGGNIELLLQSSNKDNNLNLSGYQLTRREDKTLCVDQPVRGTQTGPRDPCGWHFRPPADWPSQPAKEGCSQSSGRTQDQPGEGWGM